MVDISASAHRIFNIHKVLKLLTLKSVYRRPEMNISP